jgi:hypothetical protein
LDKNSFRVFPDIQEKLPNNNKMNGINHRYSINVDDLRDLKRDAKRDLNR